MVEEKATNNEVTSKVIANGYEIPSEFILNLQDQRFIRIGGLLWLANQMGMPKIVTRNISEPGTGEIIYEAEGRLIPNEETLKRMGFDSSYPQVVTEMFALPTVAHGTCNAQNTKPNMLKFIQVLAETRAVARCLRFMTGCSLTAVEEMDSSDIAGNLKADVTNTTAADMLKVEATSREDKVKLIGRYMDKQPYKGIVDLYCKQHHVPLFTGLNDAQIDELYLQCKAKASGQ